MDAGTITYEAYEGYADHPYAQGAGSPQLQETENGHGSDAGGKLCQGGLSLILKNGIYGFFRNRSAVKPI